mgnify:CR=1 FL=1
MFSGRETSEAEPTEMALRFLPSPVTLHVKGEPSKNKSTKQVENNTLKCHQVALCNFEQIIVGEIFLKCF